MASSSEQLTHEEIWDDSILVNTWDEALQEYKVSLSVSWPQANTWPDKQNPCASETKKKSTKAESVFECVRNTTASKPLAAM